MRTLGPRQSDKFTLLKVLLAVIVLVAIVRIVDVDRILEAAASANGWLILAGSLLLIVNLLLENLLWHRLIAGTYRNVSFGRTFGSLLFGHSLGVFTPARAGELVGRPLYLGLPDRWQVGLMVVAHRIMDLTAAVTTGAIGLMLFRTRVDVPYGSVWTGFAVAGIALGVLLFILLLFPQQTHRALNKLLRSDRLRQHISFLGLLTTRSAIVLLSLAWLRYLVYTVQFLIYIHAFAPDAPSLLGYLAVTLIMFAKFVIPPVTFSDLGIREGASVFFFSLIGVDAGAAFNASILTYCTNLLLPASLGLPFVFRMRAGRGRTPDSTSASAERMEDSEHRSSPAGQSSGQSNRFAIVRQAGSRTAHVSRGH